MRRFVHFVRQWEPSSAGQRNTHYFCYLMNLAGYPSYLCFYEAKTKTLPRRPDKPMIYKLWQDHLPILPPEEITDDDIIIMGCEFGEYYPFPHNEIVRFFLSFPASKGHEGYWGGRPIPYSELVICHPRNRGEVQRFWKRPIQDDQIFDFPSIEMGLFHLEEKTLECCHYFGKGERVYHNTTNIHLPKTSYLIEQYKPYSRQKLAFILNRTKTFYCFDPDTVIRQEAQLAGCEVIELSHEDQQKVFVDPNAEKIVQDPQRDQHFAHQFVQLCKRIYDTDSKPNRRYIHFVTQYDSHSAGQRNTHYLCHLMNKAGYSSYILFIEPLVGYPVDENRPLTNSNWHTPLLEGMPRKGDIVILSDGLGNIDPFPQCQYVRYFGYLPSATAIGYWGGSKIPSKDLVLCHPANREEVERYWQTEILEDQIFDFPSIEANLFHPLKKTINACYYYGKGERLYHNTENIHLPKDAYQIEQMRPFTREGLATLLGHTKTLYVFDPETLLRQEALLSGCKVIYLYDHNKQREFQDNDIKKLLQDDLKDQRFAHQFVQLCTRYFGTIDHPISHQVPQREYNSFNTDPREFNLYHYNTQLEADDHVFRSEKYYTVDYILPVYNELGDTWHRHYFEKVLHGIKAIDYPIQLVVVYDEKSPEELLNYIKFYFRDAKFICRNLFPSPEVEAKLFCEWGMIKAYNESTADFVCFNHSDDIPFANRVDIQLQSLLAHPKAALSLAGQWLSLNTQSRQIAFHGVQGRGFPYFGCPSSFMWNKRVLPQIKPRWKQWLPVFPTWDIIIIMEMLQSHEVVAVQHPLFVYNFHGYHIPIPQMQHEDQLFIQYLQKHKLLNHSNRFKNYP